MDRREEIPQLGKYPENSQLFRYHEPGPVDQMPGFHGCGFAGCNLSSGYQLCGLQPFEWKKGISRLPQCKALRGQGISLLGFQMDEEAFRTQIDAMS